MNALNKIKGCSLFFFSILTLYFIPFTTQAECIGVITAGGGVDFWQHVENGAKQAGEDLEYPVVVRGPMNESDNRSQQLIIQQMVEMGCKALVLAPNANEHIEQVEMLSKTGIPVVFIDRDIGGPGISIISTDNFEAGLLAGKEMIRQLYESAKIAILRFSESLNTTTERERGFIAAIKESTLEIVVDDYIGTELSDATLNAYNILSMHPEIEGIFTPNELTSLAALNMRKRIETGEKITHIGFDSHPSLIEAVSSGEMEAIIIQNPYQIGYLGVEQAMMAIKGQNTTEIIKTPFLLVNIQNINSTRVRNILAGKQQQTELATKRQTQ